MKCVILHAALSASFALALLADMLALAWLPGHYQIGGGNLSALRWVVGEDWDMPDA